MSCIWSRLTEGSTDFSLLVIQHIIPVYVYCICAEVCNGKKETRLTWVVEQLNAQSPRKVDLAMSVRLSVNRLSWERIKKCFYMFAEVTVWFWDNSVSKCQSYKHKSNSISLINKLHQKNFEKMLKKFFRLR